MAICNSTSGWGSTGKAWVVHGVLAGVAVAAAAGAYALRRKARFRSRVVGIIPARFASSRFEGKPLVSILGKPMIQVEMDFIRLSSIHVIFVMIFASLVFCANPFPFNFDFIIPSKFWNLSLWHNSITMFTSKLAYPPFWPME